MGSFEGFTNIQRAAAQSNLPVLSALISEPSNYTEKVWFSVDDQFVEESPSALYLSTLSSSNDRFDCFLQLLLNGAEFKNSSEIVKCHVFDRELILNLSVEMQQAKTSLNNLQASQLHDIKTIDQLKSHGAEEEMLHIGRVNSVNLRIKLFFFHFQVFFLLICA